MARWMGRGARLALVFLAACASAPRWTEEVSPEGLVRVEGSGFQQAWVRPHWDWSRYARVRIEDVDVERASLPRGSEARDSAELEEERLRWVVALRSAWARAISESDRFALVVRPGPDVLTVRPALRDVRSHWDRGLQPDLSYYAHRVGQGTLELEIRDARTQTLLARVTDRRSAQRTDPAVRTVGLFVRHPEVEDVARSWAQLATVRLEGLASAGSRDSLCEEPRDF